MAKRVRFKTKDGTIVSFTKKKGRKKKRSSSLRVARKPGTKLWRVMRGPIVVGLTETRAGAVRLRKLLEEG